MFDVHHLCTPQYCTVVFFWYLFDVMYSNLAIWKGDKLHCNCQACVFCTVQAVSDIC